MFELFIALLPSPSLPFPPLPSPPIPSPPLPFPPLPSPPLPSPPLPFPSLPSPPLPSLPPSYLFSWQAYLEFFTKPLLARALLEVLPKYPQVNYHIINKNVREPLIAHVHGIAHWMSHTMLCTECHKHCNALVLTCIVYHTQDSLVHCVVCVHTHTHTQLSCMHCCSAAGTPAHLLVPPPPPCRALRTSPTAPPLPLLSLGESSQERRLCNPLWSTLRASRSGR